MIWPAALLIALAVSVAPSTVATGASQDASPAKTVSRSTDTVASTDPSPAMNAHIMWDPIVHEIVRRDGGINGHTACFMSSQPTQNPFSSKQAVSSKPKSDPRNSNQRPAPTFGMQCLQLINDLRAKHGRPALSYSLEQEAQAQAWADNPAWEHNRAGQNMFSGNSRDCTSAFNSWADEITGLRNGDLIDNVWKQYGHVTQILAMNTKTVGCAVGRKTVCNFDPAGNILGTRFCMFGDQC